MKQFLSIGITALAIALLGAADAPASPSPAPSATAVPIVVHIADFKFKPAQLTVHAGDSVTFINDDGAAHTATASDKSFDSGNLDQGQKWTYVFKKPGTYAYICAYHAFMKATITVAATPAPAPTTTP